MIHFYYFFHLSFIINSKTDIISWTIELIVFLVTTIISFCLNFLITSIDDIIKSFDILKIFLKLIMVPLIRNASISLIFFFIQLSFEADW